MRLDQYLFQNGQAESRERARALIMSGIVFVNGERADKAGVDVKDTAAIEVRGSDHPYVSRGGLKLERALQVFPISVAEKVCMDIGASTGGFTDCLIQYGAKRVYAVDVGYGQLAWKLRSDARVIVLERTNIRKLTSDAVADKIDLFTVDTAFISLSIVIPSAVPFLASSCEGICLVKPQFEAGKENVGKKGVVRAPAVHRDVIEKCAGYANQNGFSVLGIDYSPITGPEGNIEFLMYVSRNDKLDDPERLTPSKIIQTVQAAHEALVPASTAKSQLRA